jgi:hypothetical protein
MKYLCLSAVLCVAFAPEAFANIIYTLDSVTFTDGGSASGSFAWDESGETLVSWNISTTAGTQQLAPFTYSDLLVGHANLVIDDFGIYFLGEPSVQQLNLNFTTSLNAGGTLALAPSREYNSYAPDFGRDVFSGVVSAVPEPSTYSLVGLGLLALIWRRNRKTNDGALP